MKLYGVPGSRALRSIWAAEETGVDYELVATHFIEDSKKPDYLALNPNGRIPTLVDDDLVLFESMAINLYLAEKYGGDLYPRDDADAARAVQWSFWGMTELEPLLMPMVLHKVMLPEKERNPAVVTKAESDIERPLAVLDAHLANREHMLGGDFTIADLNVAGALSLATFASFDLSKWSNVARWMGACTSRPALSRAQAKT